MVQVPFLFVVTTALRTIITILFVIINTICFASETDRGYNAVQLSVISQQDTLRKQQQKQKQNQQQTKEQQNREQQNNKDKKIKKELPSEFPENYHEEVEAYYARQKFPQKILRGLINIKNHTSLSTNMLFDVVLIPNIAAEFSILPKMSLSAGWMYSWWSMKSSDIFWRIYGGDITARYWFGKKSHNRRLTGHHIGIYGQALVYDFDLGGQAQLTDGWNYAAGLEYGHSFAISKNLNIDVYAGVGLLTGKYKDYSNADDHYIWQISVKRSTLFPTKLGASLVWILPFKQKSILYEE